jgi:hypothetical protein
MQPGVQFFVLNGLGWTVCGQSLCHRGRYISQLILEQGKLPSQSNIMYTPHSPHRKTEALIVHMNRVISSAEAGKICSPRWSASQSDTMKMTTMT